MADTARFLDSGYTPSRHEIAEALAALMQCDEERAAPIERALGRAGVAAAQAARAELDSAATPARVRLVRLLARIARESASEELFEALRERLADPEPAVQRAAVIGLGKLRHPDVESALLVYAAREHALPEFRVLVEALGKAGGPRAAEWLATRASDEPHTRRLLERAQLMLSRTVSRPEELEPLDLTVPLEGEQTLLLTCRFGLESILRDEVQALGPAESTPGRVVIPRFTGTLMRALSARTALGVGLELPLDRQHSLHQAVVQALRGAELFAWMAHVSHGTPRVRLAFLGQGHQRAAIWDLQTLMVREGLPLATDPTHAGWELVIDASNARLAVMPKHVQDPRFAWRCRDIPAASHPTIAAALARLGGVRADDVVWDPFVGSGLELVERGLLGDYRVMYGTDVDETALAAAKANLAAAGIKHVTLLNRDATAAPVRDVTLVLTNPPMGARLVRDGSLGDLIEAVLGQGWRVMRPGARWVWLSPMPARTASVAHHLGFDVQRRGLVDLGGLSPELQILQVPDRPKNARSSEAPSRGKDSTRPSEVGHGKRRRIVR